MVENESRPENYSDELLGVLDNMARMVYNYPTLSLTPDYLLMAILDTNDCQAKQLLDNSLTPSMLSRIYNAYSETLSERSLKAIKPNRKIEYNKALKDILENAQKEMEALGDTKVNTSHVLLSLMHENSDNELMKKVLHSVGVNYDTIKKKIMLKDGEATIEPKRRRPTEKDILKSLFGGNIKNQPNINIVSFDEAGDIMEQMLGGGKKPHSNVLEDLCVDLTEMARNGQIDTLVGRENELKSIIGTLGRKKKNNCIIVGGEGVGKTALCYGLAKKIIDGEVPSFLSRKKIVSLDITKLVAGTQYRGIFEGRVMQLLDMMKDNEDYILYVDDIAMLFNEKKNTDVDISSSFATALSDGSIQVIGSCGFKGYRNVFENNPSLLRRFQKIVLEEPSDEESVSIIKSLQESYEEYHEVKYDDNVAETCVKLAKKYITERNLPDSAIDLFDEAGSQKSIDASNSHLTDNLRREISAKERELKNFQREGKYTEAQKVQNEIDGAKLMLIDEQRKLDKKRQTQIPCVLADDIYKITAEKTGIPVARVTSDDKKKLLSIESVLKKSVIGQDEAIDVVCRAIKRNRIGMSTGRTMANLMFVGGTGLGKTLLAKKLAKEIFGDEKYLVRFDMSEYEDKTSVNKLIGSSAGYVGYENGGLLTETIKNKKYCVLLLDEFEKANQEVYNLFLQVFDEGYLSDNTGQKVDFKNIIVILTSNVGVRESNDFGKGIGFSNDDNGNKILDKELKKKFSPEFLNRLDDIVYFNKLTEDNLKDIICIELDKTKDKLRKIGHDLLYDTATINYIYEQIKDKGNYGARPIIRAIQDEVENPITDMLLEIEGAHSFKTTCENDDFKIS